MLINEHTLIKDIVIKNQNLFIVAKLINFKK